MHIYVVDFLQEPASALVVSFDNSCFYLVDFSPDFDYFLASTAFGVCASFCSRAFMWVVQLPVYSASGSIWRHAMLRISLLALLPLCPVSFGVLWLHFH